MVTSFIDMKCVILLALTFTLFYTTAIEEAIFQGKTEVLNSPGLVRRKAPTLEKCAKVCLEEKSIKCHFFKFVNSSNTCFLSENDNEDVRKFIDKVTQSSPDVAIHTPVQAGEKEEGSSRKSVDDKEIKKIEKELKQLRKATKKISKNVDKKVSNIKKFAKKGKTSIAKVKKQNHREEKAIITLQSRIHLLAKKTDQLKNEMNKVQKEQNSLLEIAKNMNASDMAIGKDVEKSLALLNEAKHNAAQIVNFNRTVQRDLKLISTQTNTIAGKIDKLLKEIKDGKYNKGLSKKVRTGQAKIAKFLSQVSSKGLQLKSQLNRLQNELVKLVKSAGKQKSENKAVVTDFSKLKETLQNLKKSFDDETDPMSKTNKKWKSAVNVVKNAVSRLVKANGQLNEEMESNKKNLLKINNVLTSAMQGIKDIKSQFGKDETNYAQLNQQVSGLIKKEAKLPTVIQMTKKTDAILKALSDLENKKKKVADKVEGYRGSLKAMSEKVSNNKKVSENYQNNLKKSQNEHTKLIGTIKHDEEKLKLVAKHVVPKQNIVAIDDKVKKVEGSLTKTQNTVKMLKHELNTVKASLSAEEIKKHISSKLRNVLVKFSQTVKGLRLQIRTEYGTMFRLRKQLKNLQHENKDLLKEMKKTKKQTDVVLKKKKHKKEKSHPKKTPHHKSSSGKKSHSHKKQHKKESLSEKRDKRSLTDSGTGGKLFLKTDDQNNADGKALSNTERPDSAGGQILSNTGYPNNAAGQVLSNTGRPNSVGGHILSNAGRPTSAGGQILSNTGYINRTGSCPQGYDLHGLNCYKLIKAKLSYDDAKRMCGSYSGNITTVNSLTKQTEITEFARANKVSASEGLWISAMNFDSKTQQLLWDTSNTEVLYSNYSSPYYFKTDPKSKRCNIFHINMNGAWIGYPCREKEDTAVHLPAVCETAPRTN